MKTTQWEHEKQKGIAQLLANASHDFDYYVLLIGAVLLALGAIFTDSIPILIASMLVAPLAHPILMLGLGLAVHNMQLALRGFGMLLLSSIIAFSLAYGLTWLFGSERAADTYISFASNHHVAVAVAVVAGAIASFGLMRPKIAPAITGVAIAVSLMPPLVATGVNLVPGGTPLAGAFSLFLLNVLGISVASYIVFSIFGMKPAYHNYNKNR